MLKLNLKIENFLSAIGLGFVIWVLLFFLTNSVFSQKVFSPYPFFYDQYDKHLNVINPAMLGASQRNLQVGFNGLNSLSSALASYYMNLQYGFSRDSLKPKHSLGFFLSNDKEGEFLDRVRALGQYAYALQLQRNLNWYSGVTAGFINNSLKPNDVTGSESVFVMELDVGTGLEYKEKWTLGISLNQIIDKPVRFLNGNYERIRYLTVIGGYRAAIGYTTKLRTLIYFRTGPDSFNKWAAQAAIEYKEIGLIGIGWKATNGLVPMVGLKDLLPGENKLGFQVSYHIAFSNEIRRGGGLMEVLLEYSF